MSTRRARFKPVLNQPARRGRSAAADAQPAEASTEAAALQEQPDKNSCPTPNQRADTRNEVLSSQVNQSTIQIKPTTDSPKVANQLSSVNITPVGNAAEEVLSARDSSHQATAPAATPAPPAANQLPLQLPLRRPSSPAQSTSETSPVKVEAVTRSSKDDGKEKSARPRRQPSSMNQRALAARRNFMKLAKDGPPQRSSLTMFDLIFYNPVTNPMSKNSPPPAKVRERQASTSSVTVQEQRLEEEKVDDVDESQKESEDKENKEAKKEEEEEEEEEEPAVPVPRVKVGPDGRIVIDEQSLVIETTESKKNREEMDKSEVVFDTGLSNGFYKRSARTKDWSNRETLKFYRALHVYGTDFSLMQVLFKDRTRRELKLKFKKEERTRMHLVDKALCSPLDFDTSELEKEALKEEEEEAARLAKEKEEKENPIPPKPKSKPVRSGKQCSRAQKEMFLDYDVNSPPKKRRTVRKAKTNPVPEPQPTGLDIFDDVILPSDKSAKEKASKPPTPRKRKAPPRDPNKSPKTSKNEKDNVLASPESDHSYAASPSCSSEYPGTAPTNTPSSKNARGTPSRAPIQNEVSAPDVTVNLPNHVVFTPPPPTPTRTVTVSPTKGATYAQLRTPKTPLSLNITHNITDNAGLPYECGPPPNTAVPVTVPMPSPVEPGSFYVLKSQCPDDPKRHVLGVYMVTNKQSNVTSPPVNTDESLVPEASITPLTDLPSQTVTATATATAGDPVEGTVLTKL